MTLLPGTLRSGPTDDLRPRRALFGNPGHGSESIHGAETRPAGVVCETVACGAPTGLSARMPALLRISSPPRRSGPRIETGFEGRLFDCTPCRSVFPRVLAPLSGAVDVETRESGTAA